MWRRRPPNYLTPRERDVLELLRRGLTNEEIAQRLDISIAGAKYHVSEILSKLGVATREEAASAVVDKPRRWWAAWPFWARIASAATAAAAVVGVAAFVYGAADFRSEKESPTQPEGVVAQHDRCDWSQYGKPGDVRLDVFEKCGVDFLFPNTLREPCSWEVIKDQAVAASWPSDNGDCKDHWGVLPEGQLASIVINGIYTCGEEVIDENGTSRMVSLHPTECRDLLPVPSPAQ